MAGVFNIFGCFKARCQEFSTFFFQANKSTAIFQHSKATLMDGIRLFAFWRDFRRVEHILSDALATFQRQKRLSRRKAFYFLSCDLFHYKCFEYVALLDVVELCKTNTTLVAVGYLAHVFLKALKRGNVVLKDYDTITNNSDL